MKQKDQDRLRELQQFEELYEKTTRLKDGGKLPNDYNKFLAFSQTAPENRRPDPKWEYGNPRQYDHYGMWDALGKPQDWETGLKNNPDYKPNPDGLYHGYSTNPNTGIWLKPHIPGEHQPGSTAWMENLDFNTSTDKNWSQKTQQLYFDPTIQRMRYRNRKALGGSIEDPIKPWTSPAVRDNARLGDGRDNGTIVPESTATAGPAAWGQFKEDMVNSIKNLPATALREAPWVALGLMAPEVKIAEAIPKIGEFISDGLKTLRFRPNTENYYRGIGKAGFNDAIESGVLRPKQGGTTSLHEVVDPITGETKTFNLGKTFDKTYYTPKFKIADQYGQGYIAEVPKDVAKFNNRYSRGKDWSVHTTDQIPINQVKLLKKNWLTGYKEVKHEYGGMLDGMKPKDQQRMQALIDFETMYERMSK